MGVDRIKGGGQRKKKVTTPWLRRSDGNISTLYLLLSLYCYKYYIFVPLVGASEIETFIISVWVFYFFVFFLLLFIREGVKPTLHS